MTVATAAPPIPAVEPAPVDAGSVDAGIPAGVPRWATECVGRVLPGATSSAVCDPFAPLAL